MVISLLNSNEQNTGEDKKHQCLTSFFQMTLHSWGLWST